jgi:hypothetical protein
MYSVSLQVSSDTFSRFKCDRRSAAVVNGEGKRFEATDCWKNEKPVNDFDKNFSKFYNFLCLLLRISADGYGYENLL